MARNWTWHLVIGSLVVMVWVFAHLYYYNLLVDLEFNTKASWAQVEAQLQRRFHIQQNLTRIVMNYSKYENDLLTRLTEMRTSARGSDPEGNAVDANQQPSEQFSSASPPAQLKQLTPLQLDKLFSQIRFVAEQYPQLKATENFQQFSAAIVDTENQIAERIMNYNDAVNIYTTTLTQFPGNIFGLLCGFQRYEFYAPDQEILNFQLVEY